MSDTNDVAVPLGSGCPVVPEPVGFGQMGPVPALAPSKKKAARLQTIFFSFHFEL